LSEIATQSASPYSAGYVGAADDTQATGKAGLQKTIQ
jgi:hypothetical protein